MADELKIIITGSLDPTATQDKIQKQLEAIQSKLNLQIGVDVEEIKKVSEQFEKLKSQINKNTKGTTIIDGTRESKEINKIQNEIQKVYVNYEDVKKHLRNGLGASLTPTIDADTNKVKSFTAEVTKSAGKIEKLKYQMNEETNVFELVSRKQVDNSVKVAEQQAQKVHQIKVDAAKKEEQILQQRIAQEKSYEQWWLSALKNREIQEQKINQDLKHRLEIYKQQAALNAQNLNRTHGGFVDNKALGEWQTKVSSLSATTPNLNREMDRLNMQFKEVSANAKTAAGAAQQAGMSFREMLSTAMVKFPVNFIPGGIKTLLIAGISLEPFKLQRKDEINLSVNV